MTKIEWPACEWCGSDEARPCRVCGRFTCWECVKYPAPDTCTHRRFEPVIGNDWNVSLNVSEVFGPTIQGEGPSLGRRCAFLRLAGCNLKCWWCDSRYAWDKQLHPDLQVPNPVTIRDIATQLKAMKVGMYVVTGGEPLIQQNGLHDLFDELLNNRAQPWIEVETNGTILPGMVYEQVNRFNVSPKLASARAGAGPKYDVLRWYSSIGADRAVFKFVCRTPDDLREVGNFNLPPAQVWIMPEGTNSADLDEHLRVLGQEAIDRGWNITDRLHIRIWGKQRGH